MSSSQDIFALGLGLDEPWTLLDQHLDTSKQPHELHLRVGTRRGAQLPCPTCGRSCKAHDFKEMTWRHLNFFQHHCYLTAPVPRVDCPEHGVKRIQVPWAREGSSFTLLFEQAALAIVREMPVAAAARQMTVTDKRLWRVVLFYVHRAVARMDRCRGHPASELVEKLRHYAEPAVYQALWPRGQPRTISAVI